MDKRDALLTLIQHTTLFSQEVKDKIGAEVATMPEEDVIKLGKLLAIAQEDTMAHIEDDIADAHALIAHLDSQVLTLG